MASSNHGGEFRVSGFLHFAENDLRAAWFRRGLRNPIQIHSPRLRRGRQCTNIPKGHLVGAVQYTTLLQYDTDNVTVQSSLKMRTLGPILQGER